MEFHELLLLSNSTLDEDTKMTIFRRSLDLKLQDKLIGTKCTKLDDLAAATIDIADQLYRIKLSSRDTSESKGRAAKPTRTSRTPSPPPPPYLKEDRMEGVEYTGKSSSSTIEKLKKERRCFRCQKKGHLAVNCTVVAVARVTAGSSKKRGTKEKKEELSSTELLSSEESSPEEESGKE